MAMFRSPVRRWAAGRRNVSLRFERLEDRRLLAVDIGLNFTGSTFNVDSTSFPPDTDGAIGLDHFVELINGRYSVYDKPSGANVQTSTLDQFWIDAGIPAPAIDATFDPRVIFDHASQRWFATSVDNRESAGSNILVGVSTDADPTMGWAGFSIDADPADNRWADFPMLGLDSAGVYLSVNMFDIEGVGADETSTVSFYSIPKADMLVVAPTIGSLTAFRDLDPSTVGFSVHPVIDYGPNDGRGAFLATSDGADSIRRTNITDAESAASTLGATANLSVTAFDPPSDAAQPGPKQDIDTGDSRFSSAAFEQDDLIWATYSVDVDGRSAIRWHQIDETTNDVLQTGTIFDADLEFYFPSIAANAFGDVVIGFSGSSDTQFVSSYVAVGETMGGTTTFGDPILTASGAADYENLDMAAPPRNRWGDYSATSLDPLSPRTFWTIQEFASAPDVWSTRITQLTIFIETDPFEMNDSIGSATVLGSEPFITVRDLSIHDADDEDFFKITAHDTGKLIVNAFFEHDIGDIDIQVQDSLGNSIESSFSMGDNERIIIPVVAQEMYFLRVFGFDDATNTYDLEIENFPAPVPDAVVIHPDDAGPPIGSYQVSLVDDPRLFIQADLFDFQQMGIDILTADEAMEEMTDGAAVEVFVNGQSQGFADLVNGTGFTLFQFQIAAGELSGTIPISDGFLNFVTAAVRIFDGQQDAVGDPDPAQGRTQLSDPLLLVADSNLNNRASIGTYAAGSVYLDANRNFVFDPELGQDLVHTLGYATDAIFAGDFSGDGFDNLAAYGLVHGQYRLLVDFSDDGIPDFVATEPAGFAVAGSPVAVDFFGVGVDGFGLFNGNTWRFDTDFSGTVSDNPALTTPIFGLPFAGDFDGNGADDVGTYNATTNTFSVLLNPNFALAGGTLDGTLVTFQISDGFPFVGVRDRPVAGDFDGDGTDDIGLWVPDRSGIPPSEAAEWYIFVSGGNPLLSDMAGMGRIVPDITTGAPVIQYTPRPFGDDLFAQFGDDFAVPIVGNFNFTPPVPPAPPAPAGVLGDFSNDGTVGQEDYEIWRAAFGAIVPPGAGADASGDGVINIADYVVWRNNQGATATVKMTAEAVVVGDADTDVASVAPIIVPNEVGRPEQAVRRSGVSESAGTAHSLFRPTLLLATLLARQNQQRLVRSFLFDDPAAEGADRLCESTHECELALTVVWDTWADILPTLS